MAEAPFARWADQSFLRTVQYADDTNLAARQSIYAFQRPSLDLPALVVDVLEMSGSESVADVGCGNGSYLGELARRGHRGPVTGIDASPGMLRAALERVKQPPYPACIVAADATALPVRSGAIDVALAAHMLYHVPEPLEAIRELRRVTAAGGRVAIVLDGRNHLRELHEVIVAALDAAGGPLHAAPGDRLRLDQAEGILASFFDTVIRHDFTGELILPSVAPVFGYVRSMALTDDAAEQERIAAAVIARLPADGSMRIRTHSGCLICS